MQVPIPSVGELLVVFTAIGVFFGGLATIILVYMRVEDRSASKKRIDAEFVRDKLLRWFQDSYQGRVTLSQGKISRHDQEDPPHFRDTHGQKLLDRYCPGLWEKWVELRTNKNARLDKLTKLYEEFLHSLIVLKESFSDFAPKGKGEPWLDFERLVRHVDEEARGRLNDNPKDFSVQMGVAKNPFRLLYDGHNDEIAVGNQSILLSLREQILSLLDGPKAKDLTSYLAQFDSETNADDFKFDREKNRAIEKLETKFRLHRMTQYGGGIVAQ